MSRRSVAAIAVVSCVTVAACSDGSTEPQSEITGSYAAVQLNGQPLPVRVTPLSSQTYGEIAGDTLVFAADGRFTRRVGYHYPASSPSRFTSTYAGSYERSGSAATLTYDGRLGPANGVLSRNTLSIERGEGRADVYVRFE